MQITGHDPARRLADIRGGDAAMTSHPNRSKMPFTVSNDYYTAKFSSNKHAMEYAERLSSFGGYATVHHKSVIVGRYHNGKTTPEFQIHHDLRANG